MDLERWTPIRGTHAIQMAAVGVTFADALPELIWERARNAARERAKRAGLDTEHVQPSIHFTVVGTPGPAAVPVGGVDFVKMETPDFFSDKFHIDRQGLRYEDWSYTRWSALLGKASDVMADAFKSYAQSAHISSIYIDYIDIFQAKLDPADRADCSTIIDANSPFVSSGVFDATNAWHTHSGRFSFPDVAVRQLQQANVDVGEMMTNEGMVQAIQIRTLITNQLNVPGLEPFAPDRQTMAVVREHMERQHDVGKSILGRLLTSKAAAAISLNNP